MKYLIDSHCHIYPDRIAEKAVEHIRHFYEGLAFAPFDGTRKTLREAGEAAGVTHFVVHSVATTPAQVSSINRFIAESQELSQGAFIGLGAMHPQSENQERDLEEILSLGFHGVKLHPDTQRFAVDGPEAFAIFELLEAKGVPVLVHTGDYRFDYSNPERVSHVLAHFPNLKMIGAHFGGWSVWDDAVRLLSDYPNFRVDTSSCSPWLSKERAEEIIRAYGPERVMFGTDYPMWRPEPELAFVRSLDLTEDELEAICYKNCAEFYGITLE